MYVCVCNAVRESDVERALAQGNATPEALVRTFNLDADSACGRCVRQVDRWLEGKPRNREECPVSGECPMSDTLVSAVRGRYGDAG